jgi:signal transduction histidine kinase
LPSDSAFVRLFEALYDPALVFEPREAIGVEVALGRGNWALIDADFDQLNRILLNLCRNAIDAGANRVIVDGSVEAATR